MNQQRKNCFYTVIYADSDQGHPSHSRNKVRGSLRQVF